MNGCASRSVVVMTAFMAAIPTVVILHVLRELGPTRPGLARLSLFIAAGIAASFVPVEVVPRVARRVGDSIGWAVGGAYGVTAFALSVAVWVGLPWLGCWTSLALLGLVLSVGLGSSWTERACETCGGWQDAVKESLSVAERDVAGIATINLEATEWWKNVTLDFSPERLVGQVRRCRTCGEWSLAFVRDHAGWPTCRVPGFSFTPLERVRTFTIDAATAEKLPMMVPRSTPGGRFFA